MALPEIIDQWTQEFRVAHSDVYAHFESETHVPWGIRSFQMTIPNRAVITELDGARDIDVYSNLFLWTDERSGTIGLEARIFPLERAMKKLWYDFSGGLEKYFKKTGASLHAFPQFQHVFNRQTNIPQHFIFQDGHGYPTDETTDEHTLQDTGELYLGYRITEKQLNALYEQIPAEFYPEEIQEDGDACFSFFMQTIIDGLVSAIHDIGPDMMQYIAWFETERQFELAYEAVLREHEQSGDPFDGISAGDDIIGSHFRKKLAQSQWFVHRQRRLIESRAKTGEWISGWAMEQDKRIRLTDPVLGEPDMDGVFVATLRGNDISKIYLWQQDNTVHCECNFRVNPQTNDNWLQQILHDAPVYLDSQNAPLLYWTESTLTHGSTHKPYLTLAVDVDIEQLQALDETTDDPLYDYLHYLQQMDSYARECIRC